MKCPICGGKLIYIDSFSDKGVKFSIKTKIGEIYKCSNYNIIDFPEMYPRCRSIANDGYITILNGETFLGKPNWLT